MPEVGVASVSDYTSLVSSDRFYGDDSLGAKALEQWPPSSRSADQNLALKVHQFAFVTAEANAAIAFANDVVVHLRPGCIQRDKMARLRSVPAAMRLSSPSRVTSIIDRLEAIV